LSIPYGKIFITLLTKHGMSANVVHGGLKEMGKVTYTFETKRPDWATPEVMATMHKSGKKLREIAALTGISVQRVSVLIKKVKDA
jgi:hypothetical protein